MFRGAILDAAEQAFASSGFHGAHVQEIARRAGVAVGTIYNHFGQKEDVLLALLDQRIVEVLEVLAPAKGDPTDFAAKLAARIERVLAFRERHAAFFGLATDLGLLGETTNNARQVLGGRPLPQTGRLSGVWLDLVDEGIAAGALVPLDRELLANLLKSTLRTVARWSRDQAPRPPGEVARTIVDVFLHGHGVPPARRSVARRKRRA
jgi:AcrR family transcriptional regulator